MIPLPLLSSPMICVIFSKNVLQITKKKCSYVMEKKNHSNMQQSTYIIYYQNQQSVENTSLKLFTIKI